MTHFNIHPSFKINGESFLESLDLISFFKEKGIEGVAFLEEWFDEKEYVLAKTSGSTGVPKEIKIKKEQMLNSASATGTYFELGPGTKALLCMSSDFIAGKMMWVRALFLGWELTVVPVSSAPLKNTKVNFDFAAMVPLQLSNSLEELDRVKTLIVGGGVVSKELAIKIQDLKTEIYATYGMTETVTHIAIKKLNKTDQEEGELYHALPSVTLSLDKRGCMIIDAPKIADDKVVTNDLIRLVSETSFEWLGRYDSIINSGGIKLISEQIENKISKVIESNFFVSGIPDSSLGEKVVLVIEGKNEKKLKNSDIKGFLSNAELDTYQFPKEIYFVDKFITTETGKIKRAAILKKYL